MNDQKIVDIIAAHRCRERGMACDEGEVWCGCCGAVVNVDDVAVHQLNALRANGIAVVELPEPDRGGGYGDDGVGWGADNNSVFTSGGMVYECGEFSPAQAREIGLWWLAAAEYAEREQ